jgi:hypothetical protein
MNDDKIVVQVLTKEGKKYWNVTNLTCPKILVGTKTADFFEKIEGMGNVSSARLSSADTLRKGESKMYPIDFFSVDDHYNKEMPNFPIVWNDIENPKRLTFNDYYVHLYDRKDPNYPEKIIGPWY